MEKCYGWKNEKKDSQITELRTFTDGKMKKKGSQITELRIDYIIS